MMQQGGGLSGISTQGGLMPSVAQTPTAEVKQDLPEFQEHVITRKDIIAYASHDPHLKSKVCFKKTFKI
jgi:hypothetical protein